MDKLKQVRDALEGIAWSNDSKWQSDCAKQALSSLDAVASEPAQAQVVPEDPQEAIARALAFAADVIDLYDDKTSEDDYMLDSDDCSAIVRALQDYPFAPALPQQGEGDDKYCRQCSGINGHHDERCTALASNHIAAQQKGSQP